MEASRSAISQEPVSELNNIPERLYMTDITIESDSKKYDGLPRAPPKINVQIFSAESANGEILSFEEKSSGKWKYDGDIEIIDGSTVFTITFDESENFGSVQVMKSELESLKKATSDKPRTERQFDMDIRDGQIIKLKFGISSEMPENTEGIDNSDADSFKEIEEDEAYEEMFSQAIERIDRGVENRRSFHAMGDHLMDLFRRTGKKRPIHNCIEAYRFAVEITPPDALEFIPFACDAGMAYLARYELAGKVKDLHGAIKYIEMSLNATTDEDRKIMLLKSLGLAYTGSFKQTGVVGDLFKAISHLEKALLLLPDDDENLPSVLEELANAFSLSYSQTGELADMNKAIAHFEKVINVTPKGHPAILSRLSSLTQLLLQRHEFTKDPNDIWQLTVCLENIAHNLPDDDENIVELLVMLQSACSTFFENIGEIVYLSQAISFAQKAIHLAPNGHRHIPKLLNDLGVCLTTRFDLTGARVDIAEAIMGLSRAVSLTPEGHSERSIRLHNLGFAYLRSFERPAWTPSRGNDSISAVQYTNLSAFQQAMSLGSAITNLQKALSIVPEDHEKMPMILNSLGVALLHRFEQRREMNDINQAITYQRKAVDLTLEGDVYMTLRLTNLGLSLKQRFRNTRNIADISEAISLQQRAADLIADDHLNKPIMLDNLGDSLAERAGDTRGEPSDIRAAISNYARSAASPAGQPGVQIFTAQKWAKLAQKFAQPDVLDAFYVAMNLLPRAAGYDQPIRKRHANLQHDMSSLSVSAATAALSSDRHDLALEWLEQGRCLVWNQINNLRTPLDPRIRSYSTVLADEMIQVSNRLAKAGSRAEPHILAPMAEKIALQDIVTEHLKLSRDWDRLLTEVRHNIPDFLHPLSCSFLLQNLPNSAIVVVINIHEERCDAIALLHGSSDPLHIPLPNFSQAKADNLRRRLKNHLKTLGRMARTVQPDVRGTQPYRHDGSIKRILSELWVCVVRPILDGLAFQKDPPSELPRIWWCATGSLAFLPIHAAGIYDGSANVASTLAEFAISSYTPTIQTLVDRVKLSRQTNQRNPGLFMVSQPDTPHQAPIPGTTAEIRAIEKLLKNRNIPFLSLERAEATVNKAITNMETHNFVHFACHASQNTDESLKSGFELYNGKLELSTIIQKQLIGANLAFLSACQTSTGDEKLSEEAVHLAAGMLAAGYRGAIATMWSISDHYAPQIAEDFYTNLMERQEGLNSDHAAQALHHATKKLRQSIGDSE